MIKILKELFGNSARELPAKKRASAAAPKEQNGGGKYRAVSLVPSLICCSEARHAMGKRVLAREARSLPLQGCTMTKDCACKFRKNADRRDCDRRLFGSGETNRWFAGPENRKGGARRSMTN